MTALPCQEHVSVTMVQLWRHVFFIPLLCLLDIVQRPSLFHLVCDVFPALLSIWRLPSFITDSEMFSASSEGLQLYC